MSTDEAVVTALIGINVGETFECVLPRDRCKKTVEVPVDPDDPSRGKRTETVIEDGATVFTLGVLDVFVLGMIDDKSSSLSRGDDGGDMRGWRNLLDQNGHDIPFKTFKRDTNGRTYHVVVDECLECLGIQDIGELGQEIKRRSEVSRAEEKNSTTA